MGGGELCPLFQNSGPAARMAALGPSAHFPRPPGGLQTLPLPIPHQDGPGLWPFPPPRPGRGGPEAGLAPLPMPAAWHANGRGAETECAQGEVGVGNLQRPGKAKLAAGPVAPEAPLGSQHLNYITSRVLTTTPSSRLILIPVLWEGRGGN